jgi:hypothetical protein
MRALVLPQALPDESHYSWVARTALLSGVGDAFRFCEQIGTGKISSVLQCKPHFQKLCNGVREGRSLSAQLIDGLTLEALKRHFYAERATTELSAEIPLDSSAAFLGSSCRWKFCDRCVVEDIESHGVAYWHRSHQFALVPSCHIHCVVLKQFAVPPALSRDKFLLPHQLSSRPVVDFREHARPHIEFWQGFAHLCSSATNDLETTVSFESANYAIQSALRSKSVMAPSGQPNWLRLKASFERGMRPLLDSNLAPNGYSGLRPAHTLTRWDELSQTLLNYCPR